MGELRSAHPPPELRPQPVSRCEASVSPSGQRNGSGRLGSVATDLEHTETACRGGAVHAEAGGEGCGEPALQRIGAEVAGDDEPGVRALVQSGDPALEHAVEFVLADTDRGVRADGPEGDVLGNIIGGHSVDIREAEVLRVAADEIEGALVDIDSPHRGVWRRECQRDRYRSPAASEVEEVAAGGRRRRVAQQHSGARIQSIRAEHSAGRRHVDVATGHGDSNGAEVLGTGG